MTTKHSKGRLARNIPPITKYPTLYAGRNEHVCTVVTRMTDPEVAEANADRLVAAWNAHDSLLYVAQQVKEIYQLTDPEYCEEHELRHLSGADVVECLGELETHLDKALKDAGVQS